MRLIVPIVARLVALVVALAVLALGLLICIEIVSHWTGNGFVLLPADTIDQLRSTTWSDSVVTYVFAGVTAVGTLLLLVAIWHRPPLTVDSNAQGVRVERHALEKSLSRHLDRTDGVSGNRVRVGRRKVRARVDTTRRLQPEQVAEYASREIATFCERHGLVLEPKVKLRKRGG